MSRLPVAGHCDNDSAGERDKQYWPPLPPPSVRDREFMQWQARLVYGSPSPSGGEHMLVTDLLNPYRWADLPVPVEPMLARATDMPEGEDWVYEPKLDGLRCVAYVRDGKVLLLSRHGKLITAFPDIEHALESLPDCVIDGEICVHDAAGTPQFYLLQQRTNIKDEELMRERAHEYPATYHVFDLLARAGLNLLSRPLENRKRLLSYLLHHPKMADSHVQYVEHHANGQALLATMRATGGEGIMAKNLRDHYMPGSRRGWIKVKFRASDEYAVVGWVDGTGWRAGGIGALLVATPTDDEGFRYVAKVGTGMDIPMLDHLLALVQPLAITECPVDNPPKGDPHWIKPDQLIVEVEFQHRTNDGSLRHPAFKGIRTDKTLADLC
jgi:bifunctional non-homologous end joining protein LigD